MKKNTIFILILAVILFASQSAVEAVDYDCAQNRHKFNIIDKVANTKKTDGHTTFECELCGFTYTEHTYAIDHKWSKWKVIKKPTCTKAGYMNRTCSRGATHTETKTIEAIGHNYKEEITREPSCTEVGIKTFTCANCGHSYIEPYGQATGHDYEEEITRESSCTEEGIKTFTCVNCGDTYTESFGTIINHDYEETVTKEPLCIEEGIRTFTCIECEDIHTEKIDAIGHNYGEWIVETPATEGKEGKRYMECMNCGDRQYEVIPALEVKEEEKEEDDAEEEEEEKFELPLAVSVGGIIGAVIFDIILLNSEISTLLWERRRKKEILEALKKEANDRYDFI